MERLLKPGTIAGNSGELYVQFGGDDTTYKCACTDAAILAGYFCKFEIILQPKFDI